MPAAAGAGSQKPDFDEPGAADGSIAGADEAPEPVSVCANVRVWIEGGASVSIIMA